jgi:hypothetical protein
MWKVLRRQGILVRSLVLVLYEVLLVAAASPVGWLSGAAWGLAASGVAAGLCLLGSLLSLWMGHVFRGPSHALIGLLLGMAANMLIPLAFGVAIHFGGSPLSQSGFIYYLIFFYLATLAMKTVLVLPVVAQSNG